MNALSWTQRKQLEIDLGVDDVLSDLLCGESQTRAEQQQADADAALERRPVVREVRE